MRCAYQRHGRRSARWKVLGADNEEVGRRGGRPNRRAPSRAESRRSRRPVNHGRFTSEQCAGVSSLVGAAAVALAHGRPWLWQTRRGLLSGNVRPVPKKRCSGAAQARRAVRGARLAQSKRKGRPAGQTPRVAAAPHAPRAQRFLPGRSRFYPVGCCQTRLLGYSRLASGRWFDSSIGNASACGTAIRLNKAPADFYGRGPRPQPGRSLTDLPSQSRSRAFDFWTS